MNEFVPWVLKVGGRELAPGAPLDAVVRAVALAVRAGRPTVVVHGGGEEISERAQALGLPVQKLRGQRVTDAAMLEIVVEVLGGRLNHRLVDALQRAGIPSVGLSGASGRLLSVRPVPGLGFVGTPTQVRARLLRTLLIEGQTPVLAPLGTGPNGGVYNVNADRAAAAVAAALRAELALLTDVPAVRGPDGAPLPRLRAAEVPRLVREGVATDGMIPKLEAAVAALDDGARGVWIGDLAGLSEGGAAGPSGTRLLPRRAAPLPVPSPRGRP